MDNTAPTSSTDQTPKNPKYLIAFDKFKKITFFGTCKVEINKTDKCLFFRTNSIDEKSQEFASTFNRIFVQKENALCIIDATSNKDFLVIFSSKETCSLVNAVINSAKFPSGPPTADPATEDHLFKNNFYIPILKEIQNKIDGFMDIKTVLLDLVNQFEPDQRQTYMNMVFEILLSSTGDSVVASAVNDSGAVTNEGNKNVCVTVDDDELVDDTFTSPTTDQSLNETAASSSYGLRKRSAIQQSDFGSSTAKKSRKSSAANGQMNTTRSNNKETVTASYEFVECFRYGAIRDEILIFTSDEKDECYEFYYSATGNGGNGWRSCKRCFKMKQRTVIKIISVENGKMEFKQGKNQHICQPIKYLPGTYTTKELSVW